MLRELIGGFVDGGVVECWSNCQVVKESKSQRVKESKSQRVKESKIDV